MANRITTILDLDGSKFGRGIKQAIEQVKQADGTLNKLRASWTGAVAAFASSPAAIAGAVAGAGLVARESIEAASALEESVNAVNVAYGRNAELVHQLGENSVDAFGMSRRAFNQFAVQFSAFATQIGAASGRNPAAVLQDITQRIADFASVNDLTLGESARKVQSALAGETEAIRQYGVDVSAGTVLEYARANGIANTSAELTEAQKVQIRYALVMEQTNKVAGDFANTQDSLANQQRTLIANTENLAAAFGTKLIPVVSDAFQTVNNLVAIYDELKSRATEILPGDGGDGWLGTYVKLVTGGPIKQARFGLEQLSDATEKLKDALSDPVLIESAAEIDRLLNQDRAPRGALARERMARAIAEGNPAFSLYVENAEHAAEATERLAEAEDEAAVALQSKNAALGRSLDHLHDYERAQLDVADAEDRLADAREAQSELLREGTISAADKARADEDVADAQRSAADATEDLFEAQADLQRVIESSIPSNEELARSTRQVEDAQRDLEDALRDVDRANRNVFDSERRLAELRAELAEVSGPQFSDETKNSPEFKAAKERADLEKKRAGLVLDIADAELDLADAHQGVQDAVRDVDDATENLTAAQLADQQLIHNGINVDDQKRAALDRVADAERRLAEANAAVGQAHVARDELLRGSIATDAEKEQAARDVERAELDLVSALEGQATAFANQKGAVDGTTTSLALQRQELERIIALNPALAAALQPALDLQNAMGAGRDITNSAQLSIASSARPPLVVNVTGLVLDPVGVGRAVTDAQNAFYRSGGYGTINPRLQ